MMRRLRIQTIAGWAGMAATTWVQAAAAGPARDPHDAEDVETLRAAAPFALDFLEQGEERAAHGDVAGALTLFQSAAGRAPQNALALRRVCEAETALGDHDAAVSACFRAGTAVLTTSRVGRVSPAQRLAAVRALVSRPGGVTPSDLASALPLAEEAAAKFPDGPWGYAALCDIAEKTGDDEMLQHALEKLERVAPDSGETRQARAAAARLRPGAGVFAGWGLVAAATMATIARAVRDAARRVRPGLAALGVALAVLGIPSVAHADGAAHISKWPIDDANPEKSIPTQEMITKDPLEMGYWIMDLVAKGQFASQRGDHAAAVKYFSVLSKAVPNRAVSYEKMCKEYLLLGDKEHGFPACAAAVSLPGATVDDYAQYVGLILATPGKLPENMTKSFDLVVSRLRAMPPQTPGVDEILCSIGMRTNDVDVLGGCVPGLAARSPNDVLTFMSQWTLAILKGDVAGARQVIENARAAGVSPETITQLEGQIATQEQKSTRATMLGGVLLVSAIVAISALVVLFRGSRKQPAGAPASTHGGPVEGVAPETNTPAA